MRLLGWLAGAMGWSLIALGASHMFAFTADLAAACLVPWASRRIQAAADARTLAVQEPNVRPVTVEQQREVAVRLFGALPLNQRILALRELNLRWDAEKALLADRPVGRIN